MIHNYGISLSPLSVLCQERESWKLVERISRSLKDRKVHAFSKHRIDELSNQIMSIARDEMTSDENDDSDFNGQESAIDFTE